jgi:hypothetical protein
MKYMVLTGFNKEKYIAYLSLLGIALHLVLRFVFHIPSEAVQWPLWIVLLGGFPLVWELGGRWDGMVTVPKC